MISLLWQIPWYVSIRSASALVILDSIMMDGSLAERRVSLPPPSFERWETAARSKYESLQLAGRGAGHYEIFKYYPNTSKAHAKVLQNLNVRGWSGPGPHRVRRDIIQVDGLRRFHNGHMLPDGEV